MNDTANNVVLESEEDEWGAEWFLPITLAEVEHLLPGVPFGIDEEERAELRNEDGMLRIVCRVDGEPDNDGDWDSSPCYSLQVYESRPATHADFEPRWEDLEPTYSRVSGWANSEAMLRENNRAQIRAARDLSIALQRIFTERANAATHDAIATRRQEIDEWNEELARENEEERDLDD
jgi:hypothetical protein